MALGPIGINERGQIVGSYTDADGTTRGFLLDWRGRFASIDVPGSTGTQAEKINNRGQVVGVYVDIPNPSPDAPRRGFLLDRGRFIRLDAPGAVATLAHGINERGQVVGEYKDAGGKTRGFLWDKGRFATFDGPDGTGAAFTEINDRGQIVGVYGEFGGPAQRGFLLSGGCLLRPSTRRAPWAPSPRHQQPRPDRGHEDRRCCRNDGPGLPAGPGCAGAVHARRLPGRHRDHGLRHQRSRPDRRRLRQPRGHAERAAEPRGDADDNAGPLTAAD